LQQLKVAQVFAFLILSYFLGPTFQFPIVKHTLVVDCLPNIMS